MKYEIAIHTEDDTESKPWGSVMGDATVVRGFLETFLQALGPAAASTCPEVQRNLYRSHPTRCVRHLGHGHAHLGADGTVWMAAEQAPLVS